MKKAGNKNFNRSRQAHFKGVFRLFFAAFSVFLILSGFVANSFATAYYIGEGDTSPGSRRGVIFHQPTGYYFVFYRDDTAKYVWRSSVDGINWSSAAEVFPAADMPILGRTAASFGSIWHVEASSRVYVAIEDSVDTDQDLADPPQTPVYARYGTLNSDGSISWSGILNFGIEGQLINDNMSDPYGGRTISICFSENGADDKVHIVASGIKDADNETGFVGVVTNAGLTSPVLNGMDEIFAEAGTNMIGFDPYPTIAPLASGGAMVVQRFSTTDGGAPTNIGWGLLSAAGNPNGDGDTTSELTSFNAYTYSSIADGQMMIDNPEAPGEVHTAFIGTNGELYYRRRSSAGVWSSAILVDNAGAAITTPYTRPTITLVKSNIWWVYMVYESTYSSLNYAVGPATATASGEFTITRDWQPVGNSPQSPQYTYAPYPMPVIYTEGTSVKIARIPTSSNPNPQITYIEDINHKTTPATVGINSTVELTIHGSGFQPGNIGLSIYESGTENVDPNISVIGTQYHSASSFTATISVGGFAVEGYRDVMAMNFDARESNILISSLAVTAPTSDLTYPVEPILYSSGIASIIGTAASSPSVGQTDIAPQVRITRDDGYQWNSINYVDPAIQGQQWLQVTSGIGNWNHTGWPNNDTAQTDGRTFTIESRGRTDDGGVGNPSNAVSFTIDKTGPSINFTAPLPNSSNNSLTAIQGTASDSLVGIKRVQMQLVDSVNNLFNDSDDKYWTGYDGTGFLTQSTWYYVVKLPSPPGTITNFTCGDECSEKSFNWIVKETPDDVSHPKLPAWVDGRKYKITAVATDKFEDVSVHVSTSGSREFYYDISHPTISLIVPEQLMPTEPISLDDPANVWRNQFNNMQVQIIDNVVDPVMGTRRVYYCIFEQGGADKWGTSCSAPAPVFAYQQYAPAADPYTFDINVSTNWQNGFWYNVAVYATDAAGNSTGTATSPVYKGYFLYDEGIPTNQITYPVNNGYYGSNSLDALLGTSDDPISKVGLVEYRLEHPPLAKWDKNTLNWIDQTDAIWNVAGTTTTPMYQVWQSSEVAQSGKWLSGEEYVFISRAKDKAGNYTTTYSTVVFKYDATPPDTQVTNPIDNATYSDNSLTDISGIAKDMPDTTRQTGLNMTCIGIQRHDGFWWNGTVNGWQATRNDSCQTPASNWTYQSMGGFWTGISTADEFKVYAWSKDNVNLPDESYRNIESSTTLKRIFKYEIQPPTSTVTSPINNEWYSDQAGYQLTSIVGTAVDLPLSGPASGGSVSNIQVEVRDEVTLTCWNGTDFTGTCGSANTWKDMVLVADSTYSYNTSTLFAATVDGRPYRVRIRAFDNALDETNSPKPNIESTFNSGRNEVVFRPDKTVPDALIQIPNQAGIYVFDSVSGTAQDANSGVNKVQIAYFSVTDVKWWDPVAKTFTLGDGTNPPPESAFVDASTTTSNPVNWSVSGSSIPTLVDNQYYRIFARAMDKVGNKTAFPGHSNVTTPPTQSSFIEIKKIVPQPDSTITNPPAGFPYYRPADLATISGTLVAANTAQIRIINVTADPDEVWTQGVWVSTVTYLAGCADDTYVIGQSTCGFFGVDNIVGTDWSKNVSNIWPAGTNQFKVQSRAAVDQNGTVEILPLMERYFYIDGEDPNTTLVEPNAEYEKSVPSIFGTASDAGIGKVQNVEIAISTLSQTYFWNGSYWVASSSWLIVNADDGAFDSGNEPWHFSTALPNFENSKTYEVQVRVTDKAGRMRYFPSPYQQFTIDTASPTSRILIPPDGATGINNISSLSGTAYDNGKNESVQIAIQQWGDPQLWYECAASTGFNIVGSTPNWININSLNGFLSSDATSWIFSPAVLNTSFSGGLKYLILVRSTDVAGNLQTDFTVGISSMIIYVDKAPPETIVTLPADYGDGISGRYKPANIGKTATSSRFYGNATDNYYAANNAGPEKTQIKLSYLLNGDTYYWTGASFSSGTAAESNAWRNASGAGSWIYVENDIIWPAGDREYKLETKSMDATRNADGTGEGNWENSFSIGQDVMRFIVDGTPPAITITTPSAVSLNSLSGISGTADGSLSGFKWAEVRISTTGVEGTKYWDGTGWQASSVWLLRLNLARRVGIIQ